MAFATYILIAGLSSGLHDRFRPEILGVSASKALAVVILDFLFVKLGCYFLNIQGASQFVDIVAYGGYKFVGVTITVIVGLLGFGRTLYMTVFLYAFGANAFFMVSFLFVFNLLYAHETSAPLTSVGRAPGREQCAIAGGDGEPGSAESADHLPLPCCCVAGAVYGYSC